MINLLKKLARLKAEHEENQEESVVQRAIQYRELRLEYPRNKKNKKKEIARYSVMYFRYDYFLSIKF